MNYLMKSLYNITCIWLYEYSHFTYPVAISDSEEAIGRLRYWSPWNFLYSIERQPYLVLQIDCIADDKPRKLSAMALVSLLPSNATYVTHNFLRLNISLTRLKDDQKIFYQSYRHTCPAPCLRSTTITSPGFSLPWGPVTDAACKYQVQAFLQPVTFNRLLRQAEDPLVFVYTGNHTYL